MRVPPAGQLKISIGILLLLKERAKKLRSVAPHFCPRSYYCKPFAYQEEKRGNGLNSTDNSGEWLKAHGACLATDNSGEMMPDAKASMASLFMPEPDDAVAHGDASLAINDFLTRIIARFVVIIITHKKSVTKTG
ncbi:hypothetical protein HanXRQr2_Chr09g0380531 [Helianthus annuus]|uniref:Uncharacterized protein n=1 Tax=Helianthus annuus TaxID=4232 RepID=A0A251TSS6_HELAN|nr:hypothetical protein HanXRQr2_Chr09g0380531 [Helianthus annuus]KAJ0525461.1 hypothetical protein HanHA300_Chr09g0312311 [Helianthus annuus]KAJ0892518.1 hypothetical protein HanPSC8_Chr09g0366821 [Helianthus annuus]